MASALDLLHRVAPPPDETTPYGPLADQVYDLRRPRSGARNVTVVIVHGGFWRPATDRTHAGPQAQALAEAGFHVVVVEYRRAERGGWPQVRDDLLNALETVAARDDLPGDTVLVGHSAGGHLVAWLAAQQAPEARAALAAVSLAGCVDLHRVFALDLGKGAAQALMGSTPEQDPQAWTAADPALLGTPRIPVVAIHGDCDDVVPVDISRLYVDAAPGTTSITCNGADHFDLIDPQAPAFRIVLDTIIELAGEPTA